MFKRTIGIGAIAATIGIAAVLPAGAAPAIAPAALDSYATSAAASALQLSLLGQDFAVSQTQAEVSNTGAPKAAADGAALLLAGSAVPGSAPAKAPEGPPTNSVCPVAADLGTITQGALSGLRLEVACVRTSASNTGGVTSAESNADEVAIRIMGPGGALVDPILGPALVAVTQVTDPLVVALEPLLGAITDVSKIDVASVLDRLTTAIGDQQFVLAEIVVAPSVSQTGADSVKGVVARAGSNGVTINILPGIASTLAQLTDLVDLPNPSVAPLLQLKLGPANAQVVRDPLTGLVTSASATAAQLLSITADDDLGLIRDVTGKVVSTVNSLPVGALNCTDGALKALACIDLGTDRDLTPAELTAQGVNFGLQPTGKMATAAHVQVLSAASDALGGSVLDLTLARATAASAGAKDLPGDDCPTPPCKDPLPLARTGGETPLALTMALLAVGSAGAALLRRTRTA